MGYQEKFIWEKVFFCGLWELEFTHPNSKEKVIIKIDEPNKFFSYREREMRRWKRIQDSLEEKTDDE